jgi:transcriptional regulator
MSEEDLGFNKFILDNEHQLSFETKRMHKRYSASRKQWTAINLDKAREKIKKLQTIIETNENSINKLEITIKSHEQTINLIERIYGQKYQYKIVHIHQLIASLRSEIADHISENAIYKEEIDTIEKSIRDFEGS